MPWWVVMIIVAAVSILFNIVWNAVARARRENIEAIAKQIVEQRFGKESNGVPEEDFSEIE